MSTEQHNPHNRETDGWTWPATMEQAGTRSPHDEIVAWLRANGLNTRALPSDPHASIADGKLTVLSKVQRNGRDVLNPDRSDVMRETLTVPVVVPPPPIVELWLAPRCPTCER